jgi:prephenate dehydrogenase
LFHEFLPQDTNVQTVAVFGVGLIGGSFALALREAGYAGRIVGVSSPATIARAIALGVIDEGLPPAEAASHADLVFLAQPIGVIIQTIGAIGSIAANLPSKALVTDAGSTKSAIMAAAAGKMAGSLFMGGHPMAGKEARGVEAACAGLFRGRVWGLTPARPEDLQQPQCREFVQWLERIGAVPLVLNAAEHDRIVALTSHLPQLASTALAATLAERTSGTPAVHGPGLEDMTRLALSSFDIWADILASNRDNVASALEAYIAALETVHREVVTSANLDICQLFERGSAFARSLRDASNRQPA